MQKIAKTGCFVFSLFGQLNKSLSSNPPQYYRYFHWEAGYLGQLLYIEAEAQDLRSTGMGCYLDDKALADFGLLTDKQDFHNFYHFTIGLFNISLDKFLGFPDADERYPPYTYEYDIFQ